jgi:hypothetical protein
MKSLSLYTFAVIFLFASCRTVNLSELNPQGRINPLLPALEVEFDMYSLEKNFPDRFNSQATYSSTSMEVTSQSFNITNVKSVDITSNDFITLFNREVKNNITNPYGEKKGKIVCRIAGKDEKATYMLRLLSLFSFGTLNVLGMPYNINNNLIDIDVEILNNNNELIGLYSAMGKGKEISSLYYGHAYPSAIRYANIKAFKEAMADIKNQIEADHERIIAGLSVK